MSGAVHFEVYIRKTAAAPWSLLLATEDRGHALQTADELLKDDRAAAVRVTRETLDPDSMEFASTTLLTRGAPEVRRKRVIPDDQAGPRCNAPSDLYAPLSRDLIGRVLEDWLMRHGVTAFELLHRPDLAERLDASGVELQHAIQKVAVPESQAVGQPVHDLVRHYQKLVEAAIKRLTDAGRRNLFPSLDDRSIADLAHRLGGRPERAFAMGGVIARAVAGARGGRAKLAALMDLADRAPSGGAPQALVLVPIEQMLCELMSARTSLTDILGPDLDQGASLAAIVRMAAPAEVERLAGQDARLNALAPVLDGPAARLSLRLQEGQFPILAATLARTVVRELMSPRRLRPADAVGEIEILRALATLLTATAGRLLTLEEVQSAFVERSRSIVTADFVAAYVKDCPTVLAEAEALARLCENVTGPANKRSAARWLAACVGSLRFETEMRAGAGATPAQKLASLAALQRSLNACGLAEADQTAVEATIGAVGDGLEAATRLSVLVARSAAPPIQKLMLLLRMAAGWSAPLGPAADRARAEAIRVLRQPQTREALAEDAGAIGDVKAMMQAARLAA